MDNWDTWIIYRLDDVSCYVIVCHFPRPLSLYQIMLRYAIPDMVPSRVRSLYPEEDGTYFGQMLDYEKESGSLATEDDGTGSLDI